MKSILLASALAFSGAAMAQDVPMTTQTAPAPAQPPVAEQPRTTVTTTTDATGTPTTTVVDVASPGNYTPPPPPDPPASYPPCSRKVIDHCRQRGGI
jgi:hypothetical protein